MRRLVFSIRFLDGRFHGRGDGGEPEWPPSPLRLFQALMAGAAPRWFNPAVRDREEPALEWLQRQPAPTIVAPAERRGDRLLTYVPNNNRGKGDEPFAKERTGKFIRPTIFGDDRVVEFHYVLDPTDSAADGCAQVLCEVARHVRCLGWGLDLAVGSATVAEGDVIEATEGRNIFRPVLSAVAGRHARRVPVKGTLASLEAVHTAKLQRFSEAGTLTLDNRQPVFDRLAYTPAPQRPFVAFRFVDDDDDTVAYPIDAIKALAGHIRHVAASICTDARINESLVNGMILGHPADGPRLSILPLPSVGHRHVDGLIRRLALAEPFGSDGTLCNVLARVLNQQPLVFEGQCDWPRARLALLDDRGRTDGVVARYAATSRTWASVTPVLLPGHNQRNGNHVEAAMRRASRLIEKSLAQADIRTPAAFEFDRLPYWAGTRHAREYHPRDKLQHCPRFHVRIEFDHCVSGPLSIGAGRHVGFGVMAAVDEDPPRG